MLVFYYERLQLYFFQYFTKLFYKTNFLVAAKGEARGSAG
jgi:hypothetical protein